MVVSPVSLSHPSAAETFVLVHGSWHTGAAWRDVVDRLLVCGHRAYAPTIAGHGPHAVRAGITHRECVDSVLTFILERDLSNIILVGHSFAGIILPSIAEQIPDRIKHLIFWDAVVLEDGTSLLDVAPPMQAAFLQAAQHSSDFSLKLPLEFWLALWSDPLLGNAYEASQARARAIWEHELAPEPFQPMLDKIPMRCFYEEIAPAKQISYLLCRQDVGLGPQFWPAMATRLPGCRILAMDGGHEALYTRPHELVGKLIEASQRGVMPRERMLPLESEPALAFQGGEQA